MTSTGTLVVRAAVAWGTVDVAAARTSATAARAVEVG
jgi:hypothetical protein